MENIKDLEIQLNDFNSRIRLEALNTLSSKMQMDKMAVSSNNVIQPINMHMHSFFSYNHSNHSPVRLAWEAKKHNLFAAGLCDFDVLDGLEEFIVAGNKLQVRTAVFIETRAFLKEFADREVNSPGEPGVIYIMGAAFGKKPSDTTKAAQTLNNLRLQANKRNAELIKRINAKVPEISIDYQKDVCSLSPGSCPTERHIVKAYRIKSEVVFKNIEKRAEFFSKLFNASPEKTKDIIQNKNQFEEKIRSVFAKKGGIGYVQPDEKTFPSADDFIQMVLECGAIPMVAWLDGTSKGESAPMSLLECLAEKGASALNIIPDRNHNIKNPEERKMKIEKLNEIIECARKLNFPINIGTELNKDGQPLYDDIINAEALKPFAKLFIEGAAVMVGSTILHRYADYSYCSKKAEAHFGNNRKAKNNFFATIGMLPALDEKTSEKMLEAGNEKAFALINDALKRNNWN
jgi:hypothetical protein